MLGWTKNKSGVSEEITLALGAKGKYYATSTIPDKGCYFRRDYSYMNYPDTCFGCEFCYIKKDEKRNVKPKTYLYFLREKFFSPNMYRTPIVMSRFCDPLFRKESTTHTSLVAKNIIENKGQFILKTAKTKIDDGIFDLMSKNPTNAQLQLRFMSDETASGKSLQKRIAPKFGYPTKMIELGIKAIAKGIPTVAVFDPYIPGVNGGNLVNLMPKLSEAGITKLIVRQLFPTKYFLGILRSFSVSRFTKFSEIQGDHYIYDNVLLLESLVPVIEAAQKYGIILSICSNRYINDLIFEGANCCQFDNPIMTSMELDLEMKANRDRKKKERLDAKETTEE